jgi:hypothetical protein
MSVKEAVLVSLNMDCLNGFSISTTGGVMRSCCHLFALPSVFAFANHGG